MLAFSATLRPNSLSATSVTLSASVPRSVKNAATADASSPALRTIRPPWTVPRSECMSQSPWSTVTTSTPTSPRTTRAAAAIARPRSPSGYAAPLAGVALVLARHLDLVDVAGRHHRLGPVERRRKRALADGEALQGRLAP